MPEGQTQEGGSQADTSSSKPIAEQQAAENSGPAVQDDWAEALEVFNDPESVSEEEELKAQETPKQNEQESDPTSHLERGEPKNGTENIDLEKLAIPQKYKGKVNDYVKPLIEKTQRDVAAARAQLAEHVEANASFINVLKDIARDPKKLADIVEQYGEQVGLEPDIVHRYKQLKYNQGNRQTVPNGQNQPPQGNPQTNVIEQISNKYKEKLVSTNDPNEFVSLMNARDFEIQQAMKNEMRETFKQLLGGYHEKAVNPLLKNFQEQTQKAQLQAQKGMWNEAGANVSKKYQDFGKYQNTVLEKLKVNPLVKAFNQDPQAMSQAGYTAESLIEEAYRIVAYNDHIEQAKNSQKNWQGGLPPNGKHINTMKTGGNDYDEIYNDLWRDK